MYSRPGQAGAPAATGPDGSCVVGDVVAYVPSGGPLNLACRTGCSECRTARRVEFHIPLPLSSVPEQPGELCVFCVWMESSIACAQVCSTECLVHR